jgi:hypothetical protein
MSTIMRLQEFIDELQEILKAEGNIKVVTFRDGESYEQEIHTGYDYHGDRRVMVD